MKGLPRPYAASRLLPADLQVGIVLAILRKLRTQFIHIWNGSQRIFVDSQKSEPFEDLLRIDGLGQSCADIMVSSLTSNDHYPGLVPFIADFFI